MTVDELIVLLGRCNPNSTICIDADPITTEDDKGNVFVLDYELKSRLVTSGGVVIPMDVEKRIV